MRKGEEEGEKERERGKAGMPQRTVPKPPQGKQKRPKVEAVGSNC